MKILKRLRSEEDGAILILAICVFMFITIITLNFTDVSLSDTLRVKRNINQTHAELISLSGIELLKGYILDYPDDFELKVADQTDSYSFPNTISMLNGSTIVDLKFLDSDNQEVDLATFSDGTHLDYSQIHSLEAISTATYLNEASSTIGLFSRYDNNSNYSIFDVFHGFYPELGSNQSAYSSHPILEQVQTPIIPSSTQALGDLKINGNSTVTKQLDPTEVYEFDDIDVNGSSKLNLELLGGPSDIHKMKVDSFSANATIDIQGEGVLVIYVANSFSLSSVAFINDPEDLLIILEENATFTLSGGTPTEFNGFVYGPFPNTKVTFSGANTVNGGFISNKYEENGSNLSLNFAPNSNLELLSSIGVDIEPKYSLQFKGYR